MKEEFLHFLWKNLLFDRKRLATSENIPVDVINPGSYNRDSGPDFFNSRIRIGETEWAGNVEIHTRSSNWLLHGHNLDHAYDNVILHVVSEHDQDAFTASGSLVETALINWDESYYQRWQEFLNAPDTIACRKDIQLIDPFIILQWISRVATDRLEEKALRIKPMLRELHNDWEETLYRLISRYYGMNVNSEPFYMLASRVPLKLVRKHSDNLLQVESLFYGQAGMLEEGIFREACADAYYNILVREYRVLKSKYSLVPMDGWIWKYHRMRPSNFPGIRISQLASLLASNDHLFARVRDMSTAEELFEIFRSKSSEYWDTRYIFGASRQKSEKRLGRSAATVIIINCIVPLVYLYGMENGKTDFCTRAVEIAQNLPAEDNRLIREWKNAGVIPITAFESQGLIGLRERLCKNRDCLNCHIGTKLISLGKDSDPRAKRVLEDPLK